MSRCFPYPPQGSALTSARKVALIESIKFQKENVRADEQRRKDKKREKKERKKEKLIQNQDNSHIVHGRIGEKLLSAAKFDFLHKASSSEERSGLTEEHGKPVRLRVPSSSSDSTENSKKRKLPPSPVDVGRGHGRVIRIRLTSKKQNPPKANVDEQKHCSTSGRTQFPPEADNETPLRQRSERFCSTSQSTTINAGKGLVLKTGGERIHLPSSKIVPSTVLKKISLPAADPVLTPLQKEGLVLKTGVERIHHPSNKIVPSPVLKKISSPAADPVLTPLQKEGSLYMNLIENFAPPSFQYMCVDTPDEDWLFGAKNKVERIEKKPICRDEVIPSCNASLFYPRSQYLPEVDIYALPYTLPF